MPEQPVKTMRQMPRGEYSAGYAHSPDPSQKAAIHGLLMLLDCYLYS
jgi:hypothetical protein